MMKGIKIYLVVMIVALLAVQSCTKMDVFPSDQITTGSIPETADGILNVTNGNYSMFKDVLEFNGFKDDNNCYVRQYFQMSDFASNDIVCGQKTEDPLYYSFTYTHSPDQANARYFWYISYKIINGANTVIEIINGDDKFNDDVSKDLLGQNYFLRANCHFNLLRFYSKSYNDGDPNSNLGVILRESASEEGEKARATLEETYNFVISDLKIAANLMKSHSLNEYASKEAAWALLSRVYLYKEEYNLSIAYADSVINSGKFTLETAASFPSYFANSLNSNESIWSIAFTSSDNRGKFGSIASMLYSDGNSGWGEEFASDSYRELLSENMNDVRWSFIDTLYNDDGNVQTKNGIKVFYITKFSFQDGDPNLSSPSMLRYSEVYLNRGESYAHLNNETSALDDVNTIRENRGLENDLVNSVPSGKTIVDVVLEERRRELAFESSTVFDNRRNKIDLERKYWGYHIKGLTPAGVDQNNPPSGYDELVIPWNDSRGVYYIPVDEIIANPLCIQN